MEGTSIVDQMISFTQELVRIESLSGGEGEAARVVQECMLNLGYDEVSVDKCGNVIGRISGNRDGGAQQTLLLDGHLDTVPPVDPQSWTVDPFSGELRDARIFGLGAADMKGSLAAMIFAAAGVSRDDISGTIFVSASVGEEVLEGAALASVVEETRPDFVLIGEPTDFRIGTAQRGRAGVVLNTHGVASHSAQPQRGDNAVYKMAEVIQRIRKMELPEDPILGEGIMELIEIQSSPFPSRSVVPTGCSARYDRRLVAAETRETVLAGIEEQLGDMHEVDVHVNRETLVCYSGYELDEFDFHPAWVVPEESELVRAVQRALAGLGVNTEPVMIHYCSNGSYSAGVAGIPTIIFGPPSIERAHAVDEYIEVKDLELAAKCFQAIMGELLAGE